MTSMLTETVRMTVPYACAGLGGVLCERSGVVNIALEGTMLASALASIAVHVATGSALSGVAAGIAMINSLGAIGGYAGPKILAYAKNNLGGYGGGFFTLALLLALGAAVTFTPPVRPQRRTSLPDLS